MSHRLAGKPRQFTRSILVVIAVSGFLVFAGFLGSPSEVENQFLLGLSRTRFAIGVVFAFLLMLTFGAILWSSLRPTPRRLRIENDLIRRISARVSWLVTVLSLFALLMGGLLLAIMPPVINVLNALEAVGARLGGLIFWLFLTSTLLVVLIRVLYEDALRDDRIIQVVDRFVVLAVLFLLVFFAYEHLLFWMKGANQSRYSYWNLLADDFLRGNLYLSNPPTTHDLTLYQGNWYVPMPPLPAVLMMPLAFLIGGENINTSDFSIFLSALNAVVFFLILEQLSIRKWITISRTGMFLLVILVLFGTPHLWVGIRGRAWFVSQIVTVLFLALAMYAALKSWSPWWVGLCIGLAVLSRPNAAMTWPFVLAIAMQMLIEDHGSPNIRQVLSWAVKSIFPISVAVGGLMLYNFARFENLLDFGYVTISGDPIIVANAQKYGIFSSHYILTNLKAMLFTFPTIQFGERWPILPSSTGMSIFLATPALLYLFHRYERKWWIMGAWLSVFLNFVFLILYHNTGAHQFGYRYILDAIIPIIAMLAVSLERKIPWHFVLLLLLSILINIYGAYWFIKG